MFIGGGKHVACIVDKPAKNNPASESLKASNEHPN